MDGVSSQHRPIVEALSAEGLRVWFDAVIDYDFESITRAIQDGLAHSKAFIAYYSHAYAPRRACQWELTAAFLAAQREGDPLRRILVLNPNEFLLIASFDRPTRVES